MIWIGLFITAFLVEASLAGDVAAGKPTTQSSMSMNAYSRLAVDGNTDNNFYAGSCTLSNYEYQPWWAVDLQQEYDIWEVVIYNRGDCCGQWLAHVTVYATDYWPGMEQPPKKDAEGSVICGTFPAAAANGQVVHISCEEGFRGRYIIVHLGGHAHLQLCEVQVMSGKLNDVAQGKSTSQSSLSTGGYSRYAVDGNTDQNFYAGSCTLSNYEYQPWWAVDLEQTFDITKVIIYNRGDCCGQWLAHVSVFSFNSMPGIENPPNKNADDSMLCGTFTGAGANGQIVHISCEEGFQARYLVVQLGHTSHLQLCEVKVLTTGDGSASGAGGAGSDGAGGEGEFSAAAQARIDALEAALEAFQAKYEECEADLLEATNTPEPIMPTLAPGVELAESAHRFRMELNGIDYILETKPYHVALKADDFCEKFGMKLAQIENQQTFDAIARWIKQFLGGHSTEVATGERSAVNLNRDVPFDAFNAAGWSCVTIVPDGDSYKLSSRKCQGERAILCAAVPIYC